jgi:uncharacterized protein YecE (DUF72 family)
VLGLSGGGSNVTKKKCQIRVGASGWHYDHWKGVFYPDDVPKTCWLNYYATKFDTVEINNTFYHLPAASTFEKWRDQVPAGFLFTLKASRYMTHIKRLLDPEDSVDLFFERAELLEDKLGPVLFQLPPSYHKDIDRLETFLQVVRHRAQSFFEFRHESWFDEDTWGLLDRFGAGLCVHDHGSSAPPRVITGKMIYLRLHGAAGGRYEGKYSDSQLKDWADWIGENRSKVTHVYAYFNNDVHGYAVENAMTLRSLLGAD